MCIFSIPYIQIILCKYIVNDDKFHIKVQVSVPTADNWSQISCNVDACRSDATNSNHQQPCKNITKITMIYIKGMYMKRIKRYIYLCGIILLVSYQFLLHCTINI